MNHYIYAYIDPRDNKIRYIGQGQGRRWLKSHKHNEQYGVWPWLQHLQSLDLEPIRFIILERLTKPQADRWEIDLIDFIGRWCEETGPLLNLTAGGSSNGQTGRKLSFETREKIANAHKGKVLTEETRRKMSERLRGNTNRTGKPHSAEIKQKISEAGKGKKRTEETRKKMSEAATKRWARKKISESLKGNTNTKRVETPD